MRRLAVALVLLSSTVSAAAQPVLSAPILWAWERTEALQKLPPGYRVAALVGSIQLSGDRMEGRGRRFPLTLAADAPLPIGVVHIEIDPSTPLRWTDILRRQVAEAVLSYASGFRTVQIDMEVRRSQRDVLLDVLRAVRAGLPPGTFLSMTALASWCDTERWLAAAPVDEIVPMLFRMGRQGARLRDQLNSGGDFAEPRCRTALGISLDAPVRFPSGRRVYVFNPRSWDEAAVASVASKVPP